VRSSNNYNKKNFDEDDDDQIEDEALDEIDFDIRF
jgi:hypothetical protein